MEGWKLRLLLQNTQKLQNYKIRRKDVFLKLCMNSKGGKKKQNFS